MKRGIRYWFRWFVRKLSAWAWQYEIGKAKDFERVRDDKWRYRVTLENMAHLLASAKPDPKEHPKMYAAWKAADSTLYLPEN